MTDMARHPELVPTRAALLGWARHPDWRGRPFLMLNLLQFRRDAAGSLQPAADAFERYVRELGGLGPEGRVVLRSGRCHGLFSSHIEPDQLLLVEWPSPELFISAVSSSGYARAHRHRSAALAATEMVAIGHPGTGFQRLGPGGVRVCPRLAELWAESEATAESQNILPDPGLLQAMAADCRLEWQEGARRPMLMLNLLKFVRPTGLDQYIEYGKAAAAAVESGEHLADRATGGLQVPLVPARTLLGATEWEAFTVMGYPRLEAFARLPENKTWQRAEKHRTAGLMVQGLVACCPDLVVPLGPAVAKL